MIFKLDKSEKTSSFYYSNDFIPRLSFKFSTNPPFCRLVGLGVRRPFSKKVLTVCLLSKQRQREWPEAKGSQVAILEYILDVENWAILINRVIKSL